MTSFPIIYTIYSFITDVPDAKILDHDPINGVKKLIMGWRTEYPYKDTLLGKKSSGIEDDGHARSKLMYWPPLAIVYVSSAHSYVLAIGRLTG